MKPPLALAAAILLAAAPVTAQGTGPANQNAPTVRGGITFANSATVELEYKSITWAQGRWANALAAKDENTRRSINNDARNTPIGELETSVELTLGGVKVDSGAYQLAFSLDEDFAWVMTLSNDDASYRWKLELQETDARINRLRIGLQAGEQDNACMLKIVFGTMACEIPGSIAMQTRRRP
jgi:hypothetical protein